MTDYTIRGDIDNQLGVLYKNVRFNAYKIVNRPDTIYVRDVLEIDDFLSTKFAHKVYNFLNAIPFDNTLKVLNNNDNQPSNHVYQSSKDIKNIKDVYSNPNNWSYERYRETMWRIKPNTLDEFANSIIYKLIDKLNINMRNYINKLYGVTELEMGTWVLQRIDNGFSMDKHTDEWGNRRISFIYYLSDPEWNEEDGGYLQVYNEDRKISIKPKLNRLIFWEIDKFPEHSVDTVTSNKARFALVGFYDEKK